MTAGSTQGDTAEDFPLAGRAGVFEQLLETLRTVRKGKVGTVVLSGPSGSGKTALLELFLEHCRTAAPQKSGFAAVFSRQFAVASILLGLMSFCGLLLTYGLNTWLPKIMEGYGYGRTYALFFPLALNLGAVVGGLVASRMADRNGPQRVIAATFALATISLGLMTFSFPLPVLFTFIATAGVGTLGTQVLVYGFQSNYFTTNARAAGVAWCASVGRLGGVLGPIIGGWLAAAGIGGATAFYIYGAVALLGGAVTILVPRQHKLEEALPRAEERKDYVEKVSK